MIEDYQFTENQLNQLKYVPRLTQDGFTKRELSDELFFQIKKYYEDNINNFYMEESGLGKNGIGNVKDLEGPAAHIAYNHDFTTLVLENLKKVHEDWCGFKLKASMGYGPRKYINGSYLQPHADKPYTHVISSIVNIDQDDNHDWPLQIYGYDDKVHEVFLKPGEILLYEGSKLLHGRIYPYKGTHFVNLFLHYRPVEYHIPRVDIDGFVKLKELTEEKDWINFYNNNTSERIVGKKFYE